MRDFDYRAERVGGGSPIHGVVQAHDAEHAIREVRWGRGVLSSVEVTPRGEPFVSDAAPRRFGSVSLPAGIVRAALALVTAAQDEAEAVFRERRVKAIGVELGLGLELSSTCARKDAIEAGRARARAEDALATEIEAQLAGRLAVTVEAPRAAVSS